MKIIFNYFFRSNFAEYFEKREADGSSVLLAPNTGFTTYCDSEGSQVLSSVAELVTAHELGHSWGAPHDPDTPECSPTAEAGGRYLMYAYAVPGYSPNNYVSDSAVFALFKIQLFGFCLQFNFFSRFLNLYSVHDIHYHDIENLQRYTTLP